MGREAMSDIQRWAIGANSPFVADDGPFVTYSDHVAELALREEELNAEWAAAMDAAVAAAQREGANQGYLNGVATNADNSYKQGQSDCKATHAVMGLKEITRIAAEGYEQGQRDAEQRIRAAVEALEFIDPFVIRAAVLAVIDGEQP
jgi:hypothetical protein